MTPQPKALDVIARKTLRAAEEDLRRWIGPEQLDNELLGALYLRVCESLERSQTNDVDAIVDDLALTIYLTASAWQSETELPLKLLSSLHQVISRTLLSEQT